MKNITGLLLGLLFICVSVGNSQSEITLEKIWKSYEYLSNRVPGFTFMNDGQHYTRLENNTVKKYNILTGQFVEDIISGNELDTSTGFNGQIKHYTFNNDESLLIIESETEQIYRRSSKAYYFLYNRSDQSFIPIFEGEKILHATLSPNGSKLAFVYQNNIYIMDIESRNITMITHDGKRNHIINGLADWVYEEEFSFTKAFFWSPDSKYISYMKFDESTVEEFTMTNYNNDLYPEYVTFKYPKVGMENAVVTVHSYNINSKKTIDFVIDEEEHYIPRIKWTKVPGTFMIFKMNRHQNHLELILAEAETGKMRKVMEEKSDYYIDITDDIRFLESGDRFIWSSEKCGYNHLYLYTLDGTEVRPLTKGNYDVTDFYGVDEKRNKIYYQSVEKSPLQRHVYSVGLNGKNKSLLTPKEGTNDAQFSSTFDYFVNTHSTINTPPTYKVYDNQSKLVRVIEDNNQLKNIQDVVDTNPVKFFDFTTSQNVDLNGWMIKPKNFDETQKYPVFMYQYGGPGSQQVTDAWKGQNYWWFQMLADMGYVVACVDNRGTGGRGEEFKKMTYLQLGHYETIDQIEAAKYLGNLSYTDPSRIGIFGWSYGGYMSTLALLKGNDIFKAAIAVAPVTNWRWYDTVYTERYMRTEEENPKGYAENSPINFAGRLKGNYLLVHGMGDDNVHFQHTVEMANALIAANKQFDTYFYPNRHHGISGGNTRLHLYTKMTNFLEDKLKSGELDNTNPEEDRP